MSVAQAGLRPPPRFHGAPRRGDLTRFCALSTPASAGYLLPLSGGADSSSTAAIVGSMCQLAVAAAASGDARVAVEVRRLMADGPSAAPDGPLPTAQELASRVLTTVYLSTVNSGAPLA